MTSWPANVSRWCCIFPVPEKLTLDDGHDGTLLDSRRALETVGVDTTEELSLQVHVIEGVGGLIVVGLDLACGKCQSGLTQSLCCLRRRCTRPPLIVVVAAAQRKQFFRGTHPQARPQDPCQP